MQVRESKFYTDGLTTTTQQRVRLHPVLTAVAVPPSGQFETMRTLAPPVGRGYEYLTGTGWDFPAELAELPGLLAAKLAAPAVQAGRYDLVIAPSNLWLVIHESIGHATELDRALGYEAAYAGTSFATPDKLGQLQYGSRLDVRHWRPDGAARAVHRRLRRRGRGRPVLGPHLRRGAGRLPDWTGGSPGSPGRPGPTAARSPTPPGTCRFSGWRTSRCSPPRAARTPMS